MGFLKAIVEVILIYVLFRIVVNFVLPMIRNFKRVKKHLQQMQDEINSRQGQNVRTQQNFDQQNKQKKVPDNDGDYIDYEEVE